MSLAIFFSFYGKVSGADLTYTSQICPCLELSISRQPLCDYHELLEDLLHFFFQPVHMPVNRLFGNLQIPGYFMSAIPLDLHQNDLKGKPVHGDQHMIQFLILNTIQKVLYCFQFCLICGCCYGIQICTCSI